MSKSVKAERKVRIRKYATHRPANILYPDRWMLGKTMQYLKLLEDQIEIDPTKVKFADYQVVLEKYLELNQKWQNQVKARRLNAKANKNTGQRVEPVGVSEDGGSDLPDEPSQDELPGVDISVPARDPFTGQGIDTI